MVEPMEIDDEPMEVDEQESIASSMPADLWMNILSFANVIDAIQLQTVSKRLFYLVHQSQTHAAPQLAASQGNVRDCLMKLSRPPTLALATGSANPPLGIPPTTVALGVKQTDTTKESLMMTTFSRGITNMFPFAIMDNSSPVDSRLLDPELELQFCIVYGCTDSENGGLNEGHLGVVIQSIQQAHPDACIVGGMCESGYVTLGSNDMYKAISLHKGIFGVAFYGFNVPTYSFVPRDFSFLPTLGRPWVVRESDFVVPEQPLLLVDGEHIIGPRAVLDNLDRETYAWNKTSMDDWSTVSVLFSLPYTDSAPYDVNDSDDNVAQFVQLELEGVPRLKKWSQREQQSGLDTTMVGDDSNSGTMQWRLVGDERCALCH